MNVLAWLWHTVFDGTRLCRCATSQAVRIMREQRK